MLTICAATAIASFGQSPEPTARKIVSDDFTKNRQQVAETPTSQGQTDHPKPKQIRRTYRLTSALKTSARPATSKDSIAQLGITIWRLRPRSANDTGARMLVRESNKISELIPERVDADTSFHLGDQVRLTIESAQTGFLYVIDREFFADGTTGPALLIYPWVGMRGGDNRVGPGRLVDIPAQEDDPAYFTARRSTMSQAGELLTIIVTNFPLDLPITDKPLPISNTQVANWEREWGGLTERFEMDGGAGETWTREEQQAAAHSNPRQLTREDPSPQTIYRVSTVDTRGFLTNVRLRYSK